MCQYKEKQITWKENDNPDYQLKKKRILIFQQMEALSIEVVPLTCRQRLNSWAKESYARHPTRTQQIL